MAGGNGGCPRRRCVVTAAGPEVPVLAAGSCRFGCAAVGFDAGDIVHGELLPGSEHLVGEGDRDGGASLLRYLHATGQIRVSLAGAAPAVARWRLASLPRGLDTAVVTALLDSCDRDTIVGRRDHAILMLLARLGLRGAEVADLRLGDVDWRSGEITVRGKGNCLDRLPLPCDVGESRVVYLTAGRPAL